MKGLKQKLNDYINEQNTFVPLSIVHQLAKEWGYKERTAERELNIGRSPEITTVYDDKKQVIGYTKQGGGVVAHEPHKLVYAGANPAPATKFRKDICNGDYHCYHSRTFKYCKCIRTEIKKEQALF